MATMTDQAPTRDDQPTGRRLLAVILLWVGTAVPVGFLTSWLGSTFAPDWAADRHRLAVVIVAEVYGLLLVSLLLVFRGPRRRDALALVPAPLRDIGVAVAVWIGAYVAAFAGYALLETISSPEPSILDVLAGVGSDAGRLADAGIGSMLLILLRVWVLVPLGEELLFRGAVFGWLRRHLPAWSTIGITAVLFAFIHQVPIMMPLAVVVGLGAGWVRERTGSVVPVIVAHTLQNVIIAVGALLLTDWTAPLPM